MLDILRFKFFFGGGGGGRKCMQMKIDIVEIAHRIWHMDRGGERETHREKILRK